MSEAQRNELDQPGGSASVPPANEVTLFGVNYDGQDDDDYESGGCCGACDGTGSVDGYEQDPNWYHPGELAPCPWCGGSGL